VDIIETVWLCADANAPNVNGYATYVVDQLPPGTSVMACCSLSAFSEGVSYENQGNAVGAASVLIRSWDEFQPDGSIKTYNSTALTNNALFINNCASVTFELAVNFAWAYAQATVFSV